MHLGFVEMLGPRSPVAKVGVAGACGLGLAICWLIAVLGIIDLKNDRGSVAMALTMLLLGAVGAVASAWIGASVLLRKRRLLGGVAAVLPLFVSALAISLAAPGATGVAVVGGLAAGGVLALVAVSIAR